MRPSLLSLSVFQTLSDEARLELARTLAGQLGPDYRASPRLCGAARLAAVMHAPTGVELVAIPGGTFVEGFREEEHEQMKPLEYVEGDDTLEWLEALAESEKPRVRVVRPFLCARAPLLRDAAHALLGEEKGWVVGDEDSPHAAIRYGKADAAKLLAKVPFRLLTDAEWEFVAREGGPLAFVNGATADQAEAACEALYDSAFDPERVDAGSNAFGLWGLPWGDWLAEAEAPRAPAFARGGAAMGYPWQNDEIVTQLCAAGRDPCGLDENGLRFALDLPGRKTKKQARAEAASAGVEQPSGVAIMAIVSKAVFEKEAPGASVGAVHATDRYRSGGKALAALAGGGTLYLVTVRPPDERLWLVAVLRGVEERDGAWVAPAPNATPITDVTALRTTLAFTSGKGLSQEKGALGMSLQTPRQLSAEDLTLLAAAIEG